MRVTQDVSVAYNFITKLSTVVVKSGDSLPSDYLFFSPEAKQNLDGSHI